MTNTWIGLGRLTADPETRHTDSGKTITNMRLAVPRPGADDRADFFGVTVFGSLAETCAKHLTKGRQVLIEGTLRQNTWTDAKSQQRRSRVDIWANRVQFLAAPKHNKGTTPTDEVPEVDSDEEAKPEAA